MALGFHPDFPDLPGFGRRNIDPVILSVYIVIIQQQ